MSEENDDSTIVEEDANNQELLEDPEKVKLSLRESFKVFLRKSGLSLVLGGIAIVLIILGVVLYYASTGLTTQKAGLWLGIAGVVIFMLTTIFGFERIE